MRKSIRTGAKAFLLLATLFLTESSAQVEGGAIVAIDEPNGFGAAAQAGGKRGSSSTKPRADSAKSRSNVSKGTASRKYNAARKVPRHWDGFVIGDKYTFMNFEVVSAAKPYHTREAKAGGASGLVQVEILIGGNGDVLTAKARTGNKLLHPEAERAALESKFNRPTVYGKPARAIGFLVYRFGPAED